MDAVTPDSDPAPRPVASIAEPRVACPRCGAHVMVESRLVDRVRLVCPVCGLHITATPEHD
jgi:hypothetical protein